MPRKGGTTARGYGSAHQRERDKWTPRVATGTIRCAKGCGRLIEPGEAWDLDHADGTAGTRAPRYNGPAHAYCNRKAGQAVGQANRRRGNRCTAPALAWFNTQSEPSDALGA